MLLPVRLGPVLPVGKTGARPGEARITSIAIFALSTFSGVSGFCQCLKLSKSLCVKSEDWPPFSLDRFKPSSSSGTFELWFKQADQAFAGMEGGGAANLDDPAHEPRIFHFDACRFTQSTMSITSIISP